MLIFAVCLVISRKNKKMPVLTFGVNDKGVRRIFNDSEVLYELGVLIRRMWDNCSACENCKLCSHFSFVVDELSRVSFTDKENDNLWRTYKETNEDSFEVEKTE